jgi:hypothetical protein
MADDVEHVIRTFVSHDSRGLPSQWEIEVDVPDDGDPWFSGFRAWGRNRSFVPRWISVSGGATTPPGPQPATVRIEVKSKTRSDTAPIQLELPWHYAAHLARTILKAERSIDHPVLDAIADRLDGRVWSCADDLEAIAELVRHTGRPVRDPSEISDPT